MTASITGIIAEYNPFHKGHLHHLYSAREKTGAEALLVVLSSNFVQRGLPAFLDKRSRTLSALRGGADLVLELPVPFSSHNAGVFASAGVDILAATGLVTHISFGVESEWNRDKILHILVHEPLSFKNKLRENLSAGFSFVEARCRALDDLLPGSGDFLKKPNNNLALSYCLRIAQKKYPIQTAPILRIGAGYHEENPTEISSATAVRKLIKEGQAERALSLLPDFSAEIVAQSIQEGTLFSDEDTLWRILKSHLLLTTPKQLAQFAEMREGLENRLLQMATEAASFEDFIDRCISRRYPRGRIQRHCIHFLLGLDHWSNRAFQRLGPPYIRVLGANGTGREVLRKMRDTATLPVISRTIAPGTPYAQKLMQLEHRGGQMRELMIASNRPHIEKNFIPVMLP